VAPDVIREIWGKHSITYGGCTNGEGAVITTGVGSAGGGNYGPGYSAFAEIHSGLVVPIGPENSPRALSVRYWRRVA